MTEVYFKEYVGYREVVKEVPFKHIKSLVNGKEVDKVLYKYELI